MYCELSPIGSTGALAAIAASNSGKRLKITSRKNYEAYTFSALVLSCRPTRRRNSNDTAILPIYPTFDSISSRQKCIEPLNKLRISGEEGRYSLNHPRCVNAGSGSLAASTLNQITRAYVWFLKSFMISRNLLYTPGLSANCFLTESK